MTDNPTTEYLGTADSVSVECDERGFELRLDTDQGRYVVNVQHVDLDAFYEQVRGRIGPYLRERDEARVRYAAGFHCDPDESAGAYDLTDPKSPGWADRMAGIHDNREGK